MMLIASSAFGLMNIGVKKLHGIPVAETIFFRSIVQIILGYATIIQLVVSPLGKNWLLLLRRGFLVLWV